MRQVFLRFLGWQVDQAILSEEDRVVIIRFGRDYVSEGFIFLFF